MAWYNPVFASEIGFLLHLPFWIDIYSEKSSEHHQPNQKFRIAIAASRVVLNVVAIICFAVAKSAAANYVGLGFLGASVILYIIAYLHIKFHARKKQVRLQKWLFLASNISVINFALDYPGNRVPSVRITHYILLITNAIMSLIAAVIITAVVPIKEAWGCYSPEHYPSLEDLNYGVCPKNVSQGICTGVKGIRCSDDIDKTADIMASLTHTLINVLFATIAVYLATAPKKLEYWQIQSVIKEKLN